MWTGTGNRPLDMRQLVRCLERQFGPVGLFPDEGYTKLHVAGVALTFPDAEKLCLGKTTMGEDDDGRVENPNPNMTAAGLSFHLRGARQSKDIFQRVQTAVTRRNQDIFVTGEHQPKKGCSVFR
jgi:hypothetical protein